MNCKRSTFFTMITIHNERYITYINFMHSGDLKTYKCVKISKSDFFTIRILSSDSTCSESKKGEMQKKETSFDTF